MRYPLFLTFVLIAFAANSQFVVSKYDSTLKIGKAGYRISCFNKLVDRNILNLRPIGFKQEAREVSFELKGTVTGAEIDDLNLDGFPDLLIYFLDKDSKPSILSVSSKNNESLMPIYFPDITNDMVLSKGYRGGDEYKLIEGILFRKFPVYEADTAIKKPTNKVRQIMYRVVEGDQGTWKFKAFKNFDMTKE
ncbi:MAG: hypothetical protein RL387_435 [Bacteroidota bacterium]|jgi:hypothetical protein